MRANEWTEMELYQMNGKWNVFFFCFYGVYFEMSIEQELHTHPGPLATFLRLLLCTLHTHIRTNTHTHRHTKMYALFWLKWYIYSWPVVDVSLRRKKTPSPLHIFNYAWKCSFVWRFDYVPWNTFWSSHYVNPWQHSEWSECAHERARVCDAYEADETGVKDTSREHRVLVIKLKCHIKLTICRESNQLYLCVRCVGATLCVRCKQIKRISLSQTDKYSFAYNPVASNKIMARMKFEKKCQS